MSGLIAILKAVPLGVWLAASAFLIGGLANAIGHPAMRASFTNLGFPAWWCWITGALEIVTALLLLVPGSRFVGVGLGACIMVVAIIAVLRRGHYGHLPPPILFLALLVLAALSHSS